MELLLTEDGMAGPRFLEKQSSLFDYYMATRGRSRARPLAPERVLRSDGQKLAGGEWMTLPRPIVSVATSAFCPRGANVSAYYFESCVRGSVRTVYGPYR